MSKTRRFTKTIVESLPLPEKGQKLVWDPELKGFGIRLTPNGRTYIAQGRVNGRNCRVTLGKHGVLTTDRARDKAKKVLSGFLDGINPNQEKKRHDVELKTLRKAADEYIANKNLSSLSIRDINKHVDKSLEAWIDKPIVSISREMVVDKHKELSRKGIAQADQAFRILRAILNFAKAYYRVDGAPIILENPVEVLNRGALNLWNNIGPREKRVPDDKIGTGWNLIQSLREDPWQTKSSRTGADLVAMLWLTGTRLSEMTTLKWEQVDLQEGWFYLPDPKNKKPVYLPLSKVAVEILKERKNSSVYIFPTHTKNSKTPHVTNARGTLSKLSEVIGVDVSAHDLRRTFINLGLKKLKIPLVMMKMLTNHKLTTDVTIEHYSEKSDMRFLKSETDMISAYIVEQGKIANAENVIDIETLRA